MLGDMAMTWNKTSEVVTARIRLRVSTMDMQCVGLMSSQVTGVQTGALTLLPADPAIRGWSNG